MSRASSCHRHFDAGIQGLGQATFCAYIEPEQSILPKERRKMTPFCPWGL